MPKSDQYFGLLLKAVGDLKEFLPHLVLVGGWAPLLYSRYLWKEEHDPLLTVDIDFGIRNLVYQGEQTIARRVSQKNWGEHHVRIGHDTPFVPVVTVGKDLKADVEFVGSPDLSSKIQNTLLGQEIVFNRVKYFEVLLEKTIPIFLSSFKVHVPHPVHFVFHKLLTFNQRGDLAKKGKDLYYAYHILLSGPDRESFAAQVHQMVLNHRYGIRVRENIFRFFEDPHSIGPTLIADIAMTTPISTFLNHVKEDAFLRIKALVSQFPRAV
ncbi:MAG: hypothetical protein IPN90_01065 [Elusimicrobia bacterium]|nr:hypothetical protein [Elusimicrobiota bacterium]